MRGMTDKKICCLKPAGVINDRNLLLKYMTLLLWYLLVRYTRARSYKKITNKQFPNDINPRNHSNNKNIHKIYANKCKDSVSQLK